MIHVYQVGLIGPWPLKRRKVTSEKLVCRVKATFPAGWSPQKVVNSKGILPEMAVNIQVKDYIVNCPDLYGAIFIIYK